ncbi:MAG: hypothetical protein WBP12_00305 [Candidatus Saccharimonas sp.]
MTTLHRRTIEQGATAIIVVVFSVLLLVTISVGFMRMIIQEQERSIENELSRGAYDSALAGVEDGKRVLEACRLDGAGSDACNAIDAKACTTVADAGFTSLSDNEVKLQTTAGVDGGFDQAYSCVIVDPDTPDYRGNLDADSSSVIPLTTAGSFQRIRLMWFQNTDLSRPVSLPTSALTPLPQLGNWTSGTTVRPPIIRAQLILYREDNFRVEDFDTADNGRTLYLYPSSVGASTVSFTNDTRAVGTSNLVAVDCDAASQYVCSAELVLPRVIDPNVASNRYAAYLRLTTFYEAADFVVTPVGTSFRDVQSIVDSTGRASNVFRRVSARVERVNSNEAQLYPRATVDITRNFCKSFGVTDTLFNPGPSCDYTQP